MREPEFEAMIAPARLYPQIWRLLLGILLIAFVAFGFIILLTLVAYAVLGQFEFGAMIGMAQMNSFRTPQIVLYILMAVGGLGLGVIIATPACHLRGPGTLFGPEGEFFRTFFAAILVCVPLYGMLAIIAFAITPAPVPNMPFGTWVKWLPFPLVIIFIQVSSEELLFRGYLPQQLAARFKSRFVWMFIPSILFGLAHSNPAAGPLMIPIIFTTFVIALIAMDLTERTGSLGAAIGLHFVNNISAIMIISMKDTITGLALFVTPTGFEDARLGALALAIDIIFLLVVWRALRWAVDR